MLRLDRLPLGLGRAAAGWCSAAVLLASAQVTLAPAALAHGGNFRQDKGDGAKDGGSVPGDLIRRGAVTTERPTWLASDWGVWWQLNRGALLPDRRALRRRNVTASGGMFGLGRSVRGGGGDWERLLRRGAVRQALPFLLEILDPAAQSDPELVAAALLAVGRIARDEPPLRILERYGAATGAKLEVRESAVLALGLLRRSRRDEQLAAETLSGIRAYLFALFDDSDSPTRVRAFAVLAVGLLADQPYPDTALERDGRRVTRALWQRLQRKYASAELPVALLTALGRQPPRGVPSGVLEGLRAIAQDKPFLRRRWDHLRRSHALSAYARLGGPAWLPIVLWVLRGTHDHAAVRSAAAIALAARAPTLDAAERKQAARSLRRSLRKEPQWFVRGLGQITLATLLREDLRRGAETLVASLGLGAYLCGEALEGRSMTRPYSAIALGLSVYRLVPRTKAGALHLKAARKTLSRALARGRGADPVLGAYAVGLGLASAETAHDLLLGILQDRHRAASLRGHCAVALAQIGRDTPAVRAALHAAVKERVSPAVHQQAVRALALFARPETTVELLGQLEKTRARYAVAVVAGALGSFGDPAAVDALLQMARDEKRPKVIRTMCVVALGLIFDPEPRPSRVQLTTHANFPARTSALGQLFDIQ